MVVTLGAFEKFKVDLDGNVARITIDNPARLNAFDFDMQKTLLRILTELSFLSSVDVVVLTGSGTAFCAGGDLKAVASVKDDSRQLATEIALAKRTIAAFLDCEQVVICRMNGDAIGLGATLALLSDIIIAADTARIGDPHVRAGLVAGDGGALLWPQLIGYARAKQYLLTGDMLSASQAAELGLINFSVPPEKLDATVDVWVEKMRMGATQAIKWTKRTINAGLRLTASAVVDAGIGHEGISLYSTDLDEAAAAFAEKRKPAFTGR
jgi:enoyl-CoA hydratase